MKILVNGDIKHLTATDNNGMEYTNDLLGMYDALHYNNDDEEAIMTADDFAWWIEIVDQLNKISTLQEIAYNNGNREEFDSKVNTISDCDLEQQTAMQLDAAEKLLNELELI